MPRERFGDETSIDPLKLLAQYRDICENLGGLRAIDSRPPRQLEERLARVEAELQTWLRLGSSERREARGEKSGSRESGVESRNGASVPGAQRLTQDSGLHPSPFTLHPSNTQSSVLSPQSIPATTVEVYSDGACSGNPGPGGYGTIVRVPGQPDKVLTGGKAHTTNNEMEMTGAIEGLRAAAALGAREVTVYTDSEYLVKGMNDWMKGWLRNGWKTRTGHPVKNRELWEELHRLSQGRAVTWKWIAGHAGHVENERCNDLAVAAARQAAARR